MSLSPQSQNSDGRPVWEPPALNYTSMTDLEEFLKQRDVLVAHYNGDVVKATTFMDLNIESRLLHKHREWAQAEIRLSAKGGEEEKFFKGLEAELEKDWREVQKDDDLGIVLAKWWDGSYYVLKDEFVDSMTASLRARARFGLSVPSSIKAEDVKT